MSDIYIFDPTLQDALSKVRGVGRYVQLLREHLGTEAEFVGSLKKVPYNATLFNPFLDILKKPFSFKRITHKQVSVIHDLIRLKYPEHFPIGVKAKFFFILNNILLSQQDIIITDSEHSKKDIIDILQVPAEKVKVLYPILSPVFTDKDYPASQPQIRLPHKYCIYVADVTWNKNIVNLAKAIKIADMPCVFVGKAFENRTIVNHPERKEFNIFVKESENDARCIFPGYLTDGELLWLYRNASCNVLVSRDEGFGFSFLEAASQSLPSVLSNSPIFHETAQDSALFAEPEDPTDIAEKIKLMCNDSPLRKELGKKSFQRSLFFSSKTFRNTLLEILN